MENDRELYIDRFSRIFVLAIEERINLDLINDVLSKSSLVRNIEKNDYSELYNNSILDIVKHYFGSNLIEDDSLYKYNDAYWCGMVYMYIFYKYRKPLSYIFLVLPLKKLLDMYDVYHEMDISAIYEVFEEISKQKTILQLLFEKHRINNAEIAKLAGVNISTIVHLKKSDNYLYAGSFNNVHRIALALNEPDNLFLDKV